MNTSQHVRSDSVHHLAVMLRLAAVWGTDKYESLDPDDRYNLGPEMRAGRLADMISEQIQECHRMNVGIPTGMLSGSSLWGFSGDAPLPLADRDRLQGIAEEMHEKSRRMKVAEVREAYTRGPDPGWHAAMAAMRERHVPKKPTIPKPR